MKKIEVILLKPLNGQPVGSRAEYAERDCERLERLGAVKRVAAKAQRAAPKNKAEGAAPANKSEG